MYFSVMCQVGFRSFLLVAVSDGVCQQESLRVFGCGRFDLGGLCFDGAMKHVLNVLYRLVSCRGRASEGGRKLGFGRCVIDWIACSILDLIKFFGSKLQNRALRFGTDQCLLAVEQLAQPIAQHCFWILLDPSTQTFNASSGLVSCQIHRVDGKRCLSRGKSAPTFPVKAGIYSQYQS